MKVVPSFFLAGGGSCLQHFGGGKEWGLQVQELRLQLGSVGKWSQKDACTGHISCGSCITLPPSLLSRWHQELLLSGTSCLFLTKVKSRGAEQLFPSEISMAINA